MTFNRGRSQVRKPPMNTVCLGVEENMECRSSQRFGMVRLAVAIASVWCAVSGCQGNGEQIRAALADREASWQRQSATLKSQQNALRSRLDGQAAGGAALKSLRATLGGLGQSSVDVDIQIRQVEPRVESAIARGGGEGSKALDEESARINGYLQTLAADVASAGEELDGIGRSQTAKSAQAE
jgi:hypothetical protein